MSKVLVLNASYEPLNITNWRRAVVLLLKGKAEQLEHNGKYIYPEFPLPTVIRLRQYVRIPYKDIPLTRRNIFARDAQTCQYCGYSGDNLTLDHVMPRSRHGGDTWENLITACIRCNVKKGNRALGWPPVKKARLSGPGNNVNKLPNSPTHLNLAMSPSGHHTTLSGFLHEICGLDVSGRKISFRAGAFLLVMKQTNTLDRYRMKPPFGANMT